MITGNYEEYCSSYEQEIQAAGGIDLQILGIGRMPTLGSTNRHRALLRGRG